MAAEKKSILNLNESNNCCSAEKLFEMILNENEVDIHTFFKEGVDINTKNSEGNTPLLLASALGRKKIVEQLIYCGADVDYCDVDEWTVLHHSSEHGWTEIVQSLVKEVRKLNARTIWGNTALHIASACGHLEVVKCLVEEGADINLKNNRGTTPVMYAVSYFYEDVFNLFLNAGANLDGYNDSKVKYISGNGITLLCTTALHTAAIAGDLEMSKCLVEEGADINALRGIDCATPLLCAARLSHKDVVHMLLFKGACVNGYDIYRRTLLHEVVIQGWLDVVQFVVERACDLNEYDMYGYTALHQASSSGHLKIVKHLVKERADINARSKLYETALHLASHVGHLEIVKFLVEEKADINARDEFGATPLLVACTRENFDIVKYLIEAKAICDIATEENGLNPLHYLISTERPNVELIKLVIENMADLPLADYDAILNSSLLKVAILQDAQFCCEVIINKFNSQVLPKLYNLPVAESLPHINKMNLECRGEVFQAIKQDVKSEIQTKGYCSLLNRRPNVLSVLSIKSILEYYDNNFNIRKE